MPYLLQYFALLVVISDLVVSAPNLRGSFESTPSIQLSTVINAQHDVLLTHTSQYRGLRGVAHDLSIVQNESPISHDWLQSIMTNPIVELLQYIVLQTTSLIRKDDDIDSFNQETEQIYLKMEILKARQHQHNHVGNLPTTNLRGAVNSDLESMLPIMVTDDDVDRTGYDTNIDNFLPFQQDDAIDDDDDGYNYFAYDDESPLYFIDYYYDYILRNTDDLFKESMERDMSEGNMKQEPREQSTVSENKILKDNYDTPDSSSITTSSIVPTPVAIVDNAKGRNLRGFPNANVNRDDSSWETVVKRKPSLCSCIIPHRYCNPDNLACPLNYDPVCGCDNTTYSNACEARYFGCNRSWKPGKC